MNNGKYTVISLFSGAGGLDCGLHQTGRFKILASVDFETNCCETLKTNREKHDNCQVIHADLSKYDPKELLAKLNLKPGEVDLVVGGPPCQSYSTLGKRRGTADPKGRLIYSYLNFINVIRPRMWLFENVDEFVTYTIETKNGIIPLVEDYAQQALKSGKYDVQGWVLNAADYGAPQSRKRVLLVGNRIGFAAETPKAEFGPPAVAENGHCKPWRTLRDAIGELREESPEITPYGHNSISAFKLIPEGGNWKDLPEGHPGRAIMDDLSGSGSSVWRRLKWDSPCPTVVTQAISVWPGFCHPAETRPLSVREAARVQGFPDDWNFCGGVGSKYKQVGNAVPIPLASAVGKVIAAALDRAESGKPKRRKWKGVFSVKWTKAGLLRSTLLGLSLPGGGNPLTVPEKEELRKLERQVRQHLDGYMKCGRALKLIRDGELHRETHSTFEAYCVDVFGIDRTRAYQFLDAVEATENVDQWSTSEERPENERQVRALRLLQIPKDQGKAWDEAVKASRMDGSTKVSGRIVEQVVNEMLGKGSKRSPDKEYPFSLNGYLVKITGNEESSPTSVKNAFYCAANDMLDLLEQNRKAVDAGDLEEIRELADSLSNIECERLEAGESRARIAPLKRGD